MPSLRIAALALLAGSAATPSGAAVVSPVVYVHGSLIDTSTGNLRPDTVIVVRGDTIEAVEAGRGYQPPPRARVVDLHGRFVLPGLINTHVHLATSAEPEIARAYLRRELFSGVTTVRDMAGDVRLLAELKREAEFDEIVSPDIVYVALFAGPSFFVDPRTHQAARGRVAGETAWMRAVDERTDLRLAIAEARGTGASGIKLYADLPASLVEAITSEAHRQHLEVWAHTAVFPAKPSEVVAAGVDVVSHACLLGYEVSDPPLATAEDRRSVEHDKVMKPDPAIDAVLAAMKQRGTILDATLFAYHVPPTHSCSAEESDHLARLAYQAGVPISAGTDDDPDWSDADSKLDAELELLVSKAGMSAADALKSATVIGARVVGEVARLGALAPAKAADFVVLRANPLEEIRNVRTVTAVVKHGIWYDRGRYRPYGPAPGHTSKHPPRPPASVTHS